MAQSMSTAAVGRVNRRFLFLALILAALSAVLVYALLSRSDSGGGASSGDGVPVVVAKSLIPAGTAITGDMLEVRTVPETAIGDGAFRTVDAAVGQVARYPIAANDQVLLTKVVGGGEIARNDVLSHIVETGKRGMAISVEAVINGGGLILPGDHVDVYWLPEEVLEDVEGAVLVAENVEVLAVSQGIVDLPATAPGLFTEDQGAVTQPGGERVRASEAEPDPEAGTVTLLLSPEQASQVFCADAGRGSIRLAVRAFGDDSPSGIDTGICIILADETQQPNTNQ